VNSAAALVSADHAKIFPEGVAQAAESIDSGAALRKLEQLADFTQSLG
jgi:anthranilate phosphoribosyltransferase